MAKPPQRHLESSADYDWRMAVDHGNRYPFDSDRHADFVRRRAFWFGVWLALGERVGIWRPFIACARRWGLWDD